MTIRLPSDYMSAFVNVARLICGGDAPTWLAEQLWCWNGRLHQDRHVEEFRPTRAEMRSILQDIEDHLFSVTEAVESPWVREFLDASPDGPIAEQRIRELEDLFYRISQMRTCSALATKSGATKPGPGKARPEAISRQTLRAIHPFPNGGGYPTASPHRGSNPSAPPKNSTPYRAFVSSGLRAATS